MKSPDELAQKLARQWQNPDIREKRLLNPDSWPLKLTVGKPTNRILTEQIAKVKAHLDRWRNVGIGKVHWEPITYRATGEALPFPVIWELQNPSDWIAAAGKVEIKNEYQRLEKLITDCDPLFHKMLIRQRHLINGKPEKEIIKAAELSMLLEPGCAGGKPLRTLSLAGIDTKFFERHRTLISKLLDIRFGHQIHDMGLESFLGALDENDHWLLLADLDGTLLPFAQQRIRAKEFLHVNLPGKRILIVENEKCLYSLPPLKDTLAILGAGLNLTWLEGSNFSNKLLAYWGDIDTWGLTMLAKARCLQPGLTPLLMTNAIFDRYENHHAVVENTPASQTPPQGLTEEETVLYNRLLTFKKNRLEQEFLPESLVARTVKTWK
jgi:hypothetical protein